MNRTEHPDFLKRHLMDLAEQAAFQHRYTCSRFLTLPEQSVFQSMRKELPVAAHLEGGSEGAIRQIAVFGAEEDLGYAFESPLVFLHIRPKSERYAEELSHRDYLGALMSLGIERSLTGDILVRGTEAWVCVLESISDFLCEQLSKIRHTEVICEKAEGEVEAPAPSFQELHLNVASERLDLLVAGAAGVNREAAKKLLKEERVFVNGRCVCSAGYRLNSGDELVLRGYGKFLYDGVSSTSRKGRSNITLRKYL